MNAPEQQNAPEPASSRRPDARGPAPSLLPLGAVVLALLALLMWQGAFVGVTHRTLSYSEFKQHLARGEVKSCRVGESEIEGKIELLEAETPPEPDPTGEFVPAERSFAFRTIRVEDPDLVQELTRAGVEYSGLRPSPISGLLLLWLVPMLLLGVFWVFMLRRSATPGQSLLAFGKSRAKLVADREVGVSFSDVAGCEEAKSDLLEIVEFLREPDRFTRLGARIPKGVLLVGPPGTGKTLLARAVAGEAKVPFFSLSGSDFVEMFVGVGAARVRDLFEQAKAVAPCIVFIDELDAIGRQRGVHVANVNDEREHTLNQLLVELDGFEPNSGVILLSATNRPDVLDPALLRPGRFDRQVVLDAPEARAREAILRVHARGKPLDPEVELETLARATPGFSGADLANAMNEAALIAVARRAARISQADLELAVERIVAGPEQKSRRLSDEERRRVAFHEVGHALVGVHSKYADRVHKISIVPRGRAALGYTLQLPTGDRHLLAKSELLDRVRGLLGGRAAEELMLGEVSTGAENDLEHATSLVRQLVCQYGMGDSAGLTHCARPEMGLPGFGGTGTQRDCGETLSSAIDEEVKQILDRAYGDAKRILSAHIDQLERIARELLARETLDEGELRALLHASP